MKKTAHKRLSLNTTTVRRLSTVGLSRAVGGENNDTTVEPTDNSLGAPLCSLQKTCNFISKFVRCPTEPPPRKA